MLLFLMMPCDIVATYVDNPYLWIIIVDKK